MIRQALMEDSQAITHIYNHYILNSVCTFEEQVITPQTIAERMDSIKAANLPWLVVESESGIAGYAYASLWKDRSAYRYSVESTVYVSPDMLGMGFGSHLYEALLAELRQQKVHTVIGGIALPNQASLRLHEKFGFQKVAHFQEVGYKFGQWVDVGYWLLII